MRHRKIGAREGGTGNGSLGGDLSLCPPGLETDWALSASASGTSVTGIDLTPVWYMLF
jgi:hypothetical protein